MTVVEVCLLFINPHKRSGARCLRVVWSPAIATAKRECVRLHNRVPLPPGPATPPSTRHPKLRHAQLIAGHGCRVHVLSLSALLPTACFTDTCSCADHLHWGERTSMFLCRCRQGRREDWGQYASFVPLLCARAYAGYRLSSSTLQYVCNEYANSRDRPVTTHVA